MSAIQQVDGDDQVQRAMARIGSVLKNKFRLDSLLGVGGMASVYAATHRNQKRVAVKLLHKEMSTDDEMKTRFLREGYAANKIGHPGAVSVLDDDISEDGAAFLVMELLEGENLEQRWDRLGGRIPTEEVLEFLDQVLDTLAAAHDKGIVHRDIKPENLFLTNDARVKILDFGIARVFEQGVKGKMTAAGTVMGTPAFMAPEQARARWDEVDGRTDQWALAASAFMLLSGRCVHEAANGNEQLIMSATKPAPSLRTFAPDVSPAVITIVDRALSYKKDKRWPDARAMQVAVRSAKAGRDVVDPFASEDASRASGAGLAARRSGAGAGPVSGTVASDPRTALVQLDDRLRAVRQRVADTQAKLAAAKSERSTVEKGFQQVSGTKNQGVEEARERLRTQVLAFGRYVLADTKSFAGDFEDGRAGVVRLQTVLETRTREVTTVKRALTIHDHQATLRGYIVTGVIVVLFVLLFFYPVIHRFFLAE